MLELRNRRDLSALNGRESLERQLVDALAQVLHTAITKREVGTAGMKAPKVGRPVRPSLPTGCVDVDFRDIVVGVSDWRFV